MKSFKILLVIFLMLGTTYVVLDKQLFYYGKNNLHIYNSLPLQFKPVYRNDFEGGFAIEDNYGFYLISRGRHKYIGTEAEIDIGEIIKYGIDDQRLVAHVVDNAGINYYITFIKNKNPLATQDILIYVLTEKENPELNNYRWIEIQNNEKRMRNIELCRNYTSIGLILSIVLIIFKTIRLKRKKKKS
jgi:hypothetical protein